MRELSPGGMRKALGKLVDSPSLLWDTNAGYISITCHDCSVFFEQIIGIIALCPSLLRFVCFSCPDQRIVIVLVVGLSLEVGMIGGGITGVWSTPSDEGREGEKVKRGS